MSRDDRDRKGGHKSRYATSDKHHGWFTRNIRKRVRNRAKRLVERGQEPEPISPIQRSYFD